MIIHFSQFAIGIKLISTLQMRDEKEGPVTKSIRLTASLILKNLVIYSSLGRSWVFILISCFPKLNFFRYFRRLRAYESHLSTISLSNVESSRTISQILFEMASAPDFWVTSTHLLDTYQLTVTSKLFLYEEIWWKLKIGTELRGSSLHTTTSLQPWPSCNYMQWMWS